MRHRRHISCISFALIGYLLVPANASGQQTRRLSLGSTGSEDVFGGQAPSLSACPSSQDDGRFLVFNSKGSTFVPDDTNDKSDVFVRDLFTNVITRVSVASDGAQGNGLSSGGSISADGRFVAFVSNASNLVDNDTNNAPDIFVHDRQTGQTKRTNLSASGQEVYHASGGPVISADGNFVAFYSQADNLVPMDINGRRDVFVVNVVTNEIQIVSVNSQGLGQADDSQGPSISADGTLITFESKGSGLVPFDTNDAYDVFVHNRLTHETVRISVASDGTQANNSSGSPSISADGQFIAFDSGATNLVENDTNGTGDVFVKDMNTGEVSLVSVTSAGAPGDDMSGHASISYDGRYIAFASVANLVGVRGGAHVYIHDRLEKTTELVSQSSSGEQGNGPCVTISSPSANGRFVAFSSLASNLVINDTNQKIDVFVRDRMSICAQADLSPKGGNGIIDVDDLLIVIDNWGAVGENQADVTGNLIVDVDDLLAVINGWGPCK